MKTPALVAFDVPAVPVYVLKLAVLAWTVGEDHHVRTFLELDLLGDPLPLAALLAPAARPHGDRLTAHAVERDQVEAIHLVVLRDDRGAVVLHLQRGVPLDAGGGQALGGFGARTPAGRVQRGEELLLVLAPYLGEATGRSR
jgi:hypothetical protein